MTIVITGFAFLIALACFWAGLKMIRLYMRVSKWKHIEAEVLQKEIVLHSKSSASRAPYGLKVMYAYQVDNEQYKSHTVYLAELAGGQVNHMKKDAEKQLDKIGEHVWIYVNPAMPRQSVIYCTGIGLYLVVLCIGFLSMLLGIYYCLK